MGVNEHGILSNLTSDTPTAATHPTVTSGSSTMITNHTLK